VTATIEKIRFVLYNRQCFAPERSLLGNNLAYSAFHKRVPEQIVNILEEIMNLDGVVLVTNLFTKKISQPCCSTIQLVVTRRQDAIAVKIYTPTCLIYSFEVLPNKAEIYNLLVEYGENI
jgi:hypothetical protein